MFSKRSITVRVLGLEDTSEADYAEIDGAYVCGVYAYHTSPVSEHLWNVTHLPTGLRLLGNLSRGQAKELCERLVKEMPAGMIDAKMGHSMEEYHKHPDFEALKKICLG